MSLRCRLFPFLHQRPERSIVQVVYVGYTTCSLQFPWHQLEGAVLTVGLSPREVVSDGLFCRIQDDSPIKRRRILQVHSREMFRPVEYVGRRKLGYDRRQYLRMSSVVNTGRFFKQKTNHVNALQPRMFYFLD